MSGTWWQGCTKPLFGVSTLLTTDPKRFAASLCGLITSKEQALGPVISV